MIDAAEFIAEIPSTVENSEEEVTIKVLKLFNYS